MNPGVYKIKCLKAGGYTLTNYGQYTFSENEELDILDTATPDTLRAGSYNTAILMCEDTTYELAQLIASGDFSVVQKTPPDLSAILNP